MLFGCQQEAAAAFWYLPEVANLTASGHPGPGHCGRSALCCRADVESDPAECRGRGCTGFHCCTTLTVAARPNTVRLRHAGKTSTLLHLGSTTAADLEALTLALALTPTLTPTPTPHSQRNLNQAAFSTLRDATYSGITVTEAEQDVERAVFGGATAPGAGLLHSFQKGSSPLSPHCRYVLEPEPRLRLRPSRLRSRTRASRGRSSSLHHGAHAVLRNRTRSSTPR